MNLLERVRALLSARKDVSGEQLEGLVNRAAARHFLKGRGPWMHFAKIGEPSQRLYTTREKRVLRRGHRLERRP